MDKKLVLAHISIYESEAFFTMRHKVFVMQKSIAYTLPLYRYTKEKKLIRQNDSKSNSNTNITGKNYVVFINRVNKCFKKSWSMEPWIIIKEKFTNNFCQRDSRPVQSFKI